MNRSPRTSSVPSEHRQAKQQGLRHSNEFSFASALSVDASELKVATPPARSTRSLESSPRKLFFSNVAKGSSSPRQRTPRTPGDGVSSPPVLSLQPTTPPEYARYFSHGESLTHTKPSSSISVSHKAIVRHSSDGSEAIAASTDALTSNANPSSTASYGSLVQERPSLPPMHVPHLPDQHKTASSPHKPSTSPTRSPQKATTPRERRSSGGDSQGRRRSSGGPSTSPLKTTKTPRDTNRQEGPAGAISPLATRDGGQDSEAFSPARSGSLKQKQRKSESRDGPLAVHFQLEDSHASNRPESTRGSTRGSSRAGEGLLAVSFQLDTPKPDSPREQALRQRTPTVISLDTTSSPSRSAGGKRQQAFEEEHKHAVTTPRTAPTLRSGQQARYRHWLQFKESSDSPLVLSSSFKRSTDSLSLPSSCRLQPLSSEALGLESAPAGSTSSATTPRKTRTRHLKIVQDKMQQDLTGQAPSEGSSVTTPHSSFTTPHSSSYSYDFIRTFDLHPDYLDPDSRTRREPMAPTTAGTSTSADSSTSAPTRASTRWLRWSDPAHHDLRKALAASRRIRKAGSDEFQEVLKAAASKGSTRGDTRASDIEASIAEAEAILIEAPIATLSPLSAPTHAQHHHEAAGEANQTSPQGSLPSHSRAPRNGFPSYLTVDGGVDWTQYTRTELETSAIDDAGMKHQNAHLLNLGIRQVIEMRGKMLEKHCKQDIVDCTIKKIKWGDKDENTDKGGLKELSESMENHLARIPEFLDVVSKGKELVNFLSKETTKKRVLEHGAESAGAHIEAQSCIQYFDQSLEQQESNDWLSEAEGALTTETIDHKLQDLLVHKKKEHDKKYEDNHHKRMGPVVAGRSDKMKKKQKGDRYMQTHLNEIMHPNDVMKHVAFQRDIVYVKFKHTYFKQAIMQDKGLEKAMEESKWRMTEEAMKGGFVTNIETKHYLRIGVMECRSLPKMSPLKNHYNDTYVRLTLRAGGKIITGRHGDVIMTTPVIWEKEHPVWQMTFDLDIPNTDEEVALTVEVYDVDIGGYAGKSEDDMIGRVRFVITNQGSRMMPLEKQFDDWHQLVHHITGENVRSNFGIAGGAGLGMDSMIRLTMLYTSRTRKTADQYIRTLQHAMLCMMARRRFAEAARMQGIMRRRTNEMPSFAADLNTQRVWEKYSDKCIECKTHPVQEIKAQIASGVVVVKNYSLSHSSVTALAEMVRVMCVYGQLTSLKLPVNDIRGQGVRALVDGILGHEQCALQELVLDGNPISRDNIDFFSLNTSENKLGFGGSAVSALSQLVEQLSSLATLSLSDCHIGSSGLASIARHVHDHPSLTALRLDGNLKNQDSNMLEAACEIGLALQTNTKLCELWYGHNALNGKDALALIGGGKWRHQGLMHSRSIKKLCLQSNNLFRDPEVVQLFAQYLAWDGCSLDYIDLAHNSLTEAGAKTFGEGLTKNERLSYLVLDKNRFGRAGYRHIMSHQGRKKVAGPFMLKADRESGPVELDLDTILEIYKNVDDNDDGYMNQQELGAFLRELGNDWSEDKIAEAHDQMAKNSEGNVDFSSFYHWYTTQINNALESDSVMHISMQDCGVVIKEVAFDAAFPEGEYDLDMSQSQNRHILLSLMKVAYRGVGQFAAESYLEWEEGGTIHKAPYEIMVPADISSWVIPHVGFLSFQFLPRKLERLLPAETATGVMLALRSVIRDTRSQLEQRLTEVEKHLDSADVQLTSTQACDLLKLLQAVAINVPKRQATLNQELIAIATRVYRNLSDPDRAPTVLDALDDNDTRLAVEIQLGIAPHAFTPRNPTGRHRLRLQKIREREMAIKLYEMRSRELRNVREDKQRIKGHGGGVRNVIERVWRNLKHNGLRFDVTDEYKVPQTGVLELDFVQITKPDRQTARPMEPEAFCKLLHKLRHEVPDAYQRIQMIREESDTSYFTCLQALALFETFSLKNYAEMYLRAEIAVCLFARITDWRGYSVLLKHLGTDAFKEVQKRIGPVNLFDEVTSPIGYWDLDLAHPEERWIMQELVHLASIEPGDNLLHCMLQGTEFDVPDQWLKNVPAEQKVSLFYARTQTVISEMIAKCLGTGKRAETAQFPPSFSLPHLPDSKTWSLMQHGTMGTWIRLEKVKVVADKLRERSSTAQEMFNRLDEDGGGSLSREEISMGLFDTDVWLPPEEMKTLLDTLDNDRSGEVDMDEFVQFWNNAPPLRFGDQAQKHYWLCRGVNKSLYEMFVPYHDLRAMYGASILSLYSMYDPLFTHKPVVRPKITQKKSHQYRNRRISIVNLESQNKRMQALMSSYDEHIPDLASIAPSRTASLQSAPPNGISPSLTGRSGQEPPDVMAEPSSDLPSGDSDEQNTREEEWGGDDSAGNHASEDVDQERAEMVSGGYEDAEEI